MADDMEAAAMTVETLSVQTFLDAWNTRDPEAVASCYAPDGVRVQVAFPSQRIEGRQALVQHVREIMTACPDCVLDVRSEGALPDGRALMEWTFSATQQADYGPIPGNGQRLVLEGVSLITADGGLISEETVYWDTATLMAAAGMISS